VQLTPQVLDFFVVVVLVLSCIAQDMFFPLCVVICVFLFSAQITVGLKLPNAIDSYMVLQREPLAARLWGWDNAESAISISLDGYQIATAKADINGSWFVELPSQKAGVGHNITISNSTANIELEHIAFGDVYLCSGQSNMEFSTNDAFNASAEIADSINYPNLRLYN
jgi:sialate O-acetylesterase